MALPEYVTPVVAVVGAPALAYVTARSLWHAVRAVLALIAGIVAMVTRDQERRKACLAILGKVAGRDGDPPEGIPEGSGPFTS